MATISFVELSFCTSTVVLFVTKRLYKGFKYPLYSKKVIDPAPINEYTNFRGVRTKSLKSKSNSETNL